MVVSDSTARRYTLGDPDVRLMLEVRDDSAAAFEELVVRYQDRLIALLDHLVNNRDLAEDLTQEVFLRVYRSRKSYMPGAKFATWLFTIANNVALNALRSRSRRKEVRLQTPDAARSGALAMEAVLAASSGQMPARRLDKAEMRDVVRIAVEALGERQRMAVLLSKFEQLSYADIGEIMNLTPQAIKSLMARARCNLRQVLEPYMQHGQHPEAEGNGGE